MKRVNSGENSNLQADEENKIITRILKKTGNPDLLSELETIPVSDLNTLLLELYRKKSQGLTPADLLRQYRQNRFSFPSDSNPVKIHRFAADFLEAAEKAGYSCLELSPVTVLGSCSVMAEVDQNNVLSALRGTEVLSDSTNNLALHIAFLKEKLNSQKPEKFRYCAVHRHIRAQKFSGKNQLPHFLLYSMVISGYDRGNYSFETEAIRETLSFYYNYLNSLGCIKDLGLLIWPGDPALTHRVISHLREEGLWKKIEEQAPLEKNYYRGLQFKIRADLGETKPEIADGGFVDWPEKLLQNKKERMLVSALGLERLMTLVSNNERPR